MIVVDNLNFGYRKKLLFEQLQLRCQEGHIYGLLGKNGAGKTTLLKLLSGELLPSSPAINYEGQSPRNIKVLERLVMVPETFTLPRCSTANFVKIYANFYPQFDRHLFDNYLERFAVLPVKNLLKQSFGQQKKFFLAFVFAAQSEILYLDEPTNGLDIPGKAAFRQICSQSQNSKRTVVISTHQVRELETLIDHVLILDQGQILLDAELEQLEQTLQVDCGLQAPETALYRQPDAAGECWISRGISEKRLDLEMLFALVTNTPDIKEQLLKWL